jgi:glyoxylase-like metal-dependent hydrolase (beta-lactamase superfamily II)
VHGGSVSILLGLDGALLVDTGVGPLAARVEAAIKRLTPLPIRYVINTHAHVDEIGGNEHFARLGATLIGNDRMRESMLHPKVRAGEAVLDGRQARQARAPSAAGAPTITFDSELALHHNGQAIRMVSVPRAHTDSDSIILFPGLDIVVVGDVLRAGEYPSINRPDGGTLQGMLDGLAKLIALGGPATRFVTSHGQVVGRAAVVAQRDLLLTTRNRVVALIAQNKTLEQVLAANVTAGLGATAQPGHISADAFVRDVYRELASAR